MKKNLKIILMIVGGVLIMTIMNGCVFRDPSIPENRTEEEYYLENSFQPFFDFLAADKKDLSTVQKYGSYLLERENAKSGLQHYKIDLARKDAELEGNYSIGYNDEKPNSTLYNVIYENEQLKYLEEVPQEYDMKLFNLQIPEKVFREMPILFIREEHPETTLQTITYNANDNIEFVKDLKKQYDIKGESVVTITLTNKGDGEFSVYISIESKSKKYVGVSNYIDFKVAGED